MNSIIKLIFSLFLNYILLKQLQLTSNYTTILIAIAPYIKDILKDILSSYLFDQLKSFKHHYQPKHKYKPTPKENK